MVTMKDVAKKANVGIATVSRVINNSGFVSEDTRRIVQKVIDEVGYVPNELARNFQKNKTNVVGVIVPSLDQLFTIALTKELEKYLRGKGYVMMLGSSMHNMSIEKEYINKLKSQHVAALIITAPIEETYDEQDLPIVSFDRKISDTVPCVYTDNYESVAYIVEKLIKSGCKNLAFVGFGADKYSLSNDRLKAFEKTCKNSNVKYQIYERKVDDDYTLEYITQILNEVNRFDGMFFSSENTARLFVSHAKKQGIDIGDKLKITAFDNLPMNKYLHPIISSVGHDYELIAKTLVDTVFKIMNENEYELETRLPYTIEEGETI